MAVNLERIESAIEAKSKVFSLRRMTVTTEIESVKRKSLEVISRSEKYPQIKMTQAEGYDTS